MTHTLFDYYKARRTARKVEPTHALQIARSDMKRGAKPYEPVKRRRDAQTGDVIRLRDRKGQKHTLVICITRDDDETSPWDRSECHGPVSGWTTRDKRPGERVLSEDGRSRRYYDVQAAQKLALREWGLAPDRLAELEKELGRKPTRREIAARAVQLDFDFLQGWCDDQWEYVGVCLFHMPRDGEYRDPEKFAQSEPFAETESFALWGIESCATEYIHNVIGDLVLEARAALCK